LGGEPGSQKARFVPPAKARLTVSAYVVHIGTADVRFRTGADLQYRN
jgi:hypothetical protein